MDTKKTASKTIFVSCPTCKKDIIWNPQQTFRPFCSERCKLIDLGEWAAGEKVIAGESVLAEENVNDDDLLH